MSEPSEIVREHFGKFLDGPEPYDGWNGTWMVLPDELEKAALAALAAQANEIWELAAKEADAENFPNPSECGKSWNAACQRLANSYRSHIVNP